MVASLALLLHGSGIDDIVVIGAAIYLGVMFGLSRLKAVRKKRARAKRKLARAQAQPIQPNLESDRKSIKR